ncbi:MAG: 4Fe-4S binding protein [Phycisphaerales bacterium]|nr:MAG: 4Fe-4S binding protein [Phycisphaerales bacterium]
MAGKIVIDTERCKGCGLCVSVCPKKVIIISRESNRSGYFPAQTDDIGCIACGHCAIVCPDGAIEVYQGEVDHIQIVATSTKRNAPQLIEEKA